MKKIIYLLILVVLASGAFFVIKNYKKTPTQTGLKTYRSQSLGVSFMYPQILTASTTSQIVALHHQVPFTHHDYCDFTGEIDTTIDTLTDFHVSFQSFDKNLVDTMKEVSPYIPSENFVNDNVVPSHGFIDEFNVGDLKGFKIFEGAEGCGHTTYYLPIQKNKTLVVKEDWVTVFSGVIDIEHKASAEAVPGVINKERGAGILDSIFQSLKVI